MIVKTEEVFKKLEPISEEDLDMLWKEYILPDAKSRKNVEDLLRLPLAKNLGETFQEKETLFEPRPKQLLQGEYPVEVFQYGKEGSTGSG
jgi:hypothetical protein